ncbi:MAG: SpaA isopeptide-forming pilin-related protein [Lachnospiraceae bacterium]
MIREEQDTELSGTESLPPDGSDDSAGSTAEEALSAETEEDSTGEASGGTADSDSDEIVTESSASVSGGGTADSKNAGTVTDSGETVSDSTGTSGDAGENSTDSVDTAAAADVDIDSAEAGTAEETESEGTTEEENTAEETKPGETTEEESTAGETKPGENAEEESTAEETKPGETTEEENTSEDSTAEETSAEKTEHLFRIYTDEETAAEGDELASSAMTFQSGPRRAAAASSAKGTASQIVAQALSRLGAGYSQANRLGPDYYDCSGLLYSCFTSLGITQNVPDTTAGWDQLCSGLDIGSVVTFSGSGGSISYQLTAKNTDVLSNPAAFSTPGTIMIFILPGASSGHAAISLGSIPRQDSGYDPNTNASAIVTATETYLKNLLSSTYGVSMSLLNGTNRVSGNPNVWTDARYLGTDMNRGADGYSGPYNSIYRVDALNTRFGVSVNNLTTGKSGSNVRYVLVPYTEPEKGNLSVSKKGKYTGTAAAGAVFDLYVDQACTSLIGEYTTDSSGSFQAAGLNAGTYYLKEKSAPDGFTPDTSTVWTVAVEKDSTAAQQVTNDEWSGTLKVLKTDAADGTAIPGGSFTLQEWSGAAGNYQDVGILTNEGGGIHQVTSYTVRSTGKTVSGGRIYYTPDNTGKFRVVETANPEGYTGSFSAEVTISKAGQEFSFTAENTPNPGKIEIRKQGLDEETGKTAPLAGSVFGIYSSLSDAQDASETSDRAVAILTTAC